MVRFFLAAVVACAIFFGATCAAGRYEGEYGNGERETFLPFAEINYGPLPNVPIAGSFSLTKSDTDFLPLWGRRGSAA